MTVPAAGTPLSNMFGRIDTDKNSGISATEMKAMLQRARVSPMVVGQATDAMMEALDANRNGQVDFGEMKANLGGVLFKYVRMPGGQQPTASQMPKATDDWFTTIDANRDNKVNQSELKEVLTRDMESEGTSFPETRAEAGARMGIYLIDDNADGSVARGELQALVTQMYVPEVP